MLLSHLALGPVPPNLPLAPPACLSSFLPAAPNSRSCSGFQCAPVVGGFLLFVVTFVDPNLSLALSVGMPSSCFGADMDMKSLQLKLGLFDQVKVVRKAQELLRLCRVHFDSSSLGVGEICKSVLCFELACAELHISFDRPKAIRVSGMSEKAYVRSLTAMQNALGLRPKVDVRELSIKFGCVRLISTVQRVLSLYKLRFVAALPESRRTSADFSRPAFTAAAFFLCSKKNKLKVDKVRLMETCGTSDPEFGNIVNSMNDLCFDLVGVAKEKRDPKTVKSNQDLLPVNLSGKRSRDNEQPSDSDDDLVDDEDDLVVPVAKKSKRASNTRAYEEWKASILVAREALGHSASDVLRKSSKQATLSFEKRDAAETLSMRTP